MKAKTNISHFQFNGEEGRSLAVTFPDTGKTAFARIVIVDEWNKARLVELDFGELVRLRDVLSTDPGATWKQGAYLHLESDDIAFTVSPTNRGEPYREGFDFNLEKEWDGYPVFIESDEARQFGKVLDEVLRSGR